ncbi:MAG: hypothetical protein RBQ81_05925 [Arcobacteraceae bacterium]|jgi:hypothetical protein|nr:hypothetical protein [Arcobacteraceae bacterium]MDY0365373.1 hypothetical protein [Arcobacteraceae bacterium]
MRRSVFSFQTIIVLTTLSVIISNLLSSVHFIPLTMAGVLFHLTKESLDQKSYYSLIIILIGFLFIESTQGFAIFSLFIISFVLYTIILPFIKRIFTFDKFKIIFDTIIFYLLILLINFLATNEFLLSIGFLLLNIVVDILIIGLFL